MEYGTALLVESTSNQVNQFGGYSGMTPRQFHASVHALAEGMGFPTQALFLGGDHLGPNAWQNLPSAQALERSEQLIHDYVAAGFQKIHLDCSMSCVDDPARLPDAVIAQRSARLAQVAEAAAAAAGVEPPVYVIGTEVPIPGGETSLASAAVHVTRAVDAHQTLLVHKDAFLRYGLNEAWCRVVALVVQPGVDFDHSHVQHYASEAALELTAYIKTQTLAPGLVYEAHSTDYQTESALRALVRDGFRLLKVGPALTFALREGLMALEHLEQELVPTSQRSHLMATLDEAMQVAPGQWNKHYVGTPGQQRLLRRFAFSDRCRYYWLEPTVKAATLRLKANLDALTLPLPLIKQYLPNQAELVLAGRLPARAQALVESRIADVLAVYARACAGT